MQTEIEERGVDGKTVRERGEFILEMMLAEAAAKILPEKKYPSFAERDDYYWLLEGELIERINKTLKYHDFFICEKAGERRLVQISSGVVFREKVPVYFLAKGLGLIGEKELYKTPPFDTKIENGKIIGVNRRM